MVLERIALARALVVDGQVVILDEPTESIDEKGRKSIYNLIKNFIKSKKTLIISTQDDEILSNASCIIDLDTKPIPKNYYLIDKKL